MRTINVDQLHAEWAAQGVPREHNSVKCPVCGTVQTFAEVRAAVEAAPLQRLRDYFGADKVEPLLHFGFSCIGRFTGAAGFKEPGWKEGKGCNWTLGGFFQAHRLVVIAPDGQQHPYFEPATPEEAQAHLRAKEETA